MSSKKLVKRIYNVAIITILLAFIGLICKRFIHPGDVEYTDDAQVCRHITPINARVGGFIKEVRFEGVSSGISPSRSWPTRQPQWLGGRVGWHDHDPQQRARGIGRH